MPSMRSHPVSSQSTPHSAPARLVLSGTGDLAQLTYDALDESEALRYVRDAGAGATVLFVGTTRDTFQSKQVLRLEYEAYSKLAMRTLESILQRARSIDWPPAPPTSSSVPLPITPSASNPQPAAAQQVTRIFVAHRLGHVPVGEASILVCASAPHRRRAFEVAEWALEEVKRDVQVWKREVYGSDADADASLQADEETNGVWKENKDV